MHTSPTATAEKIKAHFRQFTPATWPSLEECRTVAAWAGDHISLPNRSPFENQGVAEAFAEALAESCDFDCTRQEAVEESVNDFFFHAIREEEQAEEAAEQMHVCQERAAYFANQL